MKQNVNSINININNEKNDINIFEENSYYFYIRRENKPFIKVKYIGIITAKEPENKKKHLFIEEETKKKFCISCNAVREKNFQKTYK